MQSDFDKICDRLSNAVDKVQFDRFRWDRDEAPKLKRLIELLRASIANRADFELTEEGATSDAKRFVVKIHSKRIIGLAVSLEKGNPVIGVETIERSPFALTEKTPITADYAEVNEEWMDSVLTQLFSRVRHAE